MNVPNQTKINKDKQRANRALEMCAGGIRDEPEDRESIQARRIIVESSFYLFDMHAMLQLNAC